MPRKPTIDDRLLVRLIDKEGMTMTAAAKKLGVSRQAVSQRLQELRPKTTTIIATTKLKQVTENRLDAIEQLQRINDRANEILDQAVEDSHLALKCMAEIRQQLGLQLQIFQALFDLQAVEEFQSSVLEAIREVSPEVKNAIIAKLNNKRAIRQAVKFS